MPATVVQSQSQVRQRFRNGQIAGPDAIDELDVWRSDSVSGRSVKADARKDAGSRGSTHRYASIAVAAVPEQCPQLLGITSGAGRCPIEIGLPVELD